MTLSAEQQATLGQLRDIALPAVDESGLDLFWLLALAAVAATLISLIVYWRDRRYPWRQAALAELRRLDSLPPRERTLALQQLLRRLSMLQSAEARVAEGNDWLELLNRQWSTNYFSSPQADWMQARYQATAPLVGNTELATVRALIRQRTRWPW